MNDIAKTTASANAVAALQQLRTGLQNVKDALPATMGDPFLRLLKDGGWVYGQDNVEVQDGSLWIINPFLIQHGFVSWTRHKDVNPKDNTKDTMVGEVMRPMTQAKPDRATLSNTGWDWADQVAFPLVCLTGEDEGEQVLYKNTSVGGITAVKDLLDQIMKQLDRDPSKPCPVITLESESYMHKNYGKTYVPIFTVHAWRAVDDVELPGDSPANGAAEPAPQAQAAQQASSPAQAEAPTRAVRQRRAPATPAAEQAPAAQQAQPAQAEAAATEPVRRRRRVS